MIKKKEKEKQKEQEGVSRQGTRAAVKIDQEKEQKAERDIIKVFCFRDSVFYYCWY